MEFPSYSTPHPNIRTMSYKLAKAFKLKSLGVLFSHTSQQKPQSNGGFSNEFYPEKVHPHPQNSSAFDIEQVFESISALKLAYVNLQSAHIPYDSLKITAADQCIVLQLDKLDKIMRIKKGESDSCHVDLQLLDELESEIKARESRIIRLKREVQEMSFGNVKMIEEFSISSSKEECINVGLFGEIYGGFSNAVRDFARLMIMLMRDSDLDLDCAADSIENSVVYAKRSHKKYAFQAFVARRMLHLFSSQSHGNHGFDHKLRFQDPIFALMEEPNSAFGEFCISKYLLLIHPKLEASLFGNLDHRHVILKGKHPRTAFYQVFVKMSRWVWLLRGIAGLAKAKLQMFGVQRGANFGGLYMESVTSELGSCSELKVELMVMPGFRIGNDIVKCKVYTSTIS